MRQRRLPLGINLAGMLPGFVRRWRLMAIAMALATLLSACAAPASTPPPPTYTPTATVSPETEVPSSPVSEEVRTTCSDGRLLVGDLPRMDTDWEAGLAASTEKARAWQPDA